MSISKPVTRRESLLAGSSGPVTSACRLATWVAPGSLLNPRQATAQHLQRMLNAKNNNDNLILSMSSNGYLVNCNCPGTYEKITLVHLMVEEINGVPR